LKVKAEWQDFVTDFTSKREDERSDSKGRAVGRVFQIPRYANVFRPTLEQHQPLAGVEKLAERSTAYLRRMAVSDRPRPLLLTGAKGSGKTSLAKLIGRIAETDRELLSGEFTR